MRKLKYGLFYDTYIQPQSEYFWDSGLIGAHIYVANLHIKNKKTEGWEYFYIDDNDKIHIVKDAKPIEMVYAQTFGKVSPKNKVFFRDRAVIEKEKNNIEDEDELTL